MEMRERNDPCLETADRQISERGAAHLVELDERAFQIHTAVMADRQLREVGDPFARRATSQHLELRGKDEVHPGRLVAIDDHVVHQPKRHRHDA